MALSELLGSVTTIVLQVREYDGEFVRRHAAQSIRTVGIVLVLGMIFGTVVSVLSLRFVTGAGGGPFLLGGRVSPLFGRSWLVFSLGPLGRWRHRMLRAHQGETPRVPVAAGIAELLV